MLLFFPSDRYFADAQLAAASSHAQQVNCAVAQLKPRQCPRVNRPGRMTRPWRCFGSSGCGERFQGKRFNVCPGTAVLEMIKAQSGNCLGEGDSLRLVDSYVCVAAQFVEM